MSTRALSTRATAAIWFVVAVLTVLVACAAMACGSSDQVGAAGTSGQIVFSARAAPDGDGGWQLYVTNADGGGLEELTSFDGYGDRWPEWSPDGEKVAFHRCCRDDGQGGEESDIWLVDRDGGNERRLVHGSGPAWSPDGQEIVFTRYVPTSPNDEDAYDLWLVDVETGRESRLLRHAHSPAWSPDGERILFQRSKPHTEGLYAMRADGRDVRALIPSDEPLCASWSPAGDQIAYKTFFDGEVYVMSADGENVRRVTKHKDEYSAGSACPTWSPDGTQMVYSLLDPALHVRNHRELIFVVGADGTSQRRISPDRGFVKDGSPEWSPDGARIAFANGELGELWVMGPDGSGRKKLVSGPFAELYDGLDWARAPS